MVKIVMVRQAGDAGQLYGSVNIRDVAEGVVEAGFSINKNQIKLANPIKSIGLHAVAVNLHPEVSVSIAVNVARSIDEAKIQDKTGSINVDSEAKDDSVELLIKELDSTESNLPSETEAKDQAAKAKAVSEVPYSESVSEDLTEAENKSDIEESD